MIVALFVLALAMIVGGIASIVQGAPFIRLEMGWTMVIAGSVAMSGGAVLAGVAAAVWRLRRIELELVEARETGARLPAMPAIPSPLPPGFALPPLPEERAPALGPDARREAALAPMQAALPETAHLAPDERAVLAAGDLMPPLSARRDEEPALADLAMPVLPERRGAPDLRMPTEPAAPEKPARETPGQDILGEDILGGDILGQEIVPAQTARQEEAREETAQREEERQGVEHREDAHASSVPHEPPAPPNPPADASEAAVATPSEPPPRVVAGTYTSGGNTYVMYSDGSIEAETPGGKYTFSSLEELKAFASKEGEGAPAAGQA